MIIDHKNGKAAVNCQEIVAMNSLGSNRLVIFWEGGPSAFDSITEMRSSF